MRVEFDYECVHGLTPDSAAPGSTHDIIDDAIEYFKANVFFKNYDVKVASAILVFSSILNDSNSHRALLTAS